MTPAEVLKGLEARGHARVVDGMQRFGITTSRSYGVPTPQLKQWAREVKKHAADRHALALELWETDIYDARAVAFLIDDPKQVTEEQMDRWAAGIDNWATVDGTCGYLFCRTPYAYKKARTWTAEEPEFVKRAGFSMMAYLAVHDKKAPDEKLAAFLPLIEENADDDRNFVKKAVNWALRQIGKRSRGLNELAVDAAKRIRQQETRSARWIAADALRELTNEKTLARIAAKARTRQADRT